MAQLFNETVPGDGTESDPITVVPGTVVGVESDHPVEVLGGTGGRLALLKGPGSANVIPSGPSITLRTFVSQAAVTVHGESA